MSYTSSTPSVRQVAFASRRSRESNARILASERFALAPQEAIDAVNAHDRQRFLECFDNDASVLDRGTRSAGIEAVAYWIDVAVLATGVTWESPVFVGGLNSFMARARWHNGNGLSSEPRNLAFRLIDGLIAELVITD